MAKNLWAAIGRQTSRTFFYLWVAMTVAFTVLTIISPVFRSSPSAWLALAIFWSFAYLGYHLNFRDSSLIKVVTEVQLTTGSEVDDEESSSEKNFENKDGDGGVGVKLEGYYECPTCHTVFRGDGFCFNCLMRETGLPPRVVFKGKTIA